jgi:hypothetical protein
MAKSGKARASKKIGRGRESEKETTAGRADSAVKTRVAAEDLPRRPLEDCVAVAKKLHDEFAGGTTPWDDLADALGVGRATNSTKYLFWAAVAYGLLNKEPENSFSLSELGRKIVAPTYDGEGAEGLLKAATTPSVLSRFYTDYANHSIPSDELFGNVLERKYGIPRDRHAEAKDVIVSNAEYVGILAAADSEGRRYLRIAPSGVVSTPVRHQPTTDGGSLDDSLSGDSVDSADRSDWDKVCFYITPVGDDGSEPRRHADMMLRHVVEPAAKEHGLQVVRADKIDRSGIITKQILEYLLYSRMCVADLSFNNPNAFYELGVRHVSMKACPQIIRKGDKIPFDVSQGRTIVVDTADPYTITDRLVSASRELSEHIMQALADGGGSTDENPIQVYLPGVSIKLPRREGAS